MNLYLVLALALGAASPAPRVPKPIAPNVMAQSAERDAVSVEHRLQPVHAARLKPGLHRSPLAARLVSTGAASPRAPALV